MKRVNKVAGVCMLAVLLAACGGGGGGGSSDGAPDAAAPVAQVTGQQPVDEAPAPVAAATTTADASGGAEALTEVAESVATDPWVQTWVDADLDAYYPTRPIRVSVTGQGTVGNEVRGTVGPMNCVQGGSSCGVSYTKYTTVVLTAVPKAGQVFRGWSGACIGSGTRSTCEIRNYMLHNVGATFAPA